MSFVPDFRPPPRTLDTVSWFLFREQRIFVKQEGNNYLIPQSADLERLNLAPKGAQFLGSLGGNPCYVAELPRAEQISGAYSLIGLRDLFLQGQEDMIRAAGLANQLLQWNQNHRYCGRCGNLTEDKRDERAKICPQCGLISYPRLSPAIIVAVVKEDRILLAHSQRFPAKFYSVLAGFVEPGETLEECVEREVHEEVGISVQDIRYFGSQPWPFPDSLMVAFTADYAGGEIEIDRSEIADAGWFSADQLPPIPPKISIARQLIDWFSGTNQNRPGR